MKKEDVSPGIVAGSSRSSLPVDVSERWRVRSQVKIEVKGEPTWCCAMLAGSPGRAWSWC